MTQMKKIQYHYKELLKLAAKNTLELSDLKDIIRDKLAELVNRTCNDLLVFNNYIAAKHSQLSQDQ